MVVDESTLWDRDNRKQLLHILHELLYLRKTVISNAETRLATAGHDWPDKERKFSAVNLCLYLAFRQHDVRPLQEELAELALSSLGRGEPDILNNIDHIIKLLVPIFGTHFSDHDEFNLNQQGFKGKDLLAKRNDRLFGHSTSHHYTRIMITMPTEAAVEGNDMVRSLVENDMASARINCAHDTPQVWMSIANNIKQARQDLNKECKIFMDLAGIKIRTGALAHQTHDETKIRLFEGDVFELSCSAKCSVPATTNPLTDTQTPAVVSCTNNVFLDHINPGDSVWIDDGKLGSQVEEIRADSLLLRVTHAGPKGVRIKADKGINFPDTKLSISALTEKDLEDMDFVCEHADIIGISFVQSAADIEQVMNELAQRNSCLPIVAKIETKQAVENLPEILLTGLSYQGEFSIMIARGDLAVELGSVRMAEIQEEILWLCEAAHIPVIWATQVLESLAKKGVVSRPEITDAAMSVRAECVMLNKGQYIIDAASVLGQILDRMQAHQYKKAPRLRALHW